MNPMIMLRGGNILQPLIKNEPKWGMRLVYKLVGPYMFKDYPYKEAYFLEQAKRIREVVNCNMIYVGGASSNDSFEKIMAAGFDFIQLGRTLLADPDLPKQAAEQSNFVSRCNHCNGCIGTIEHPKGIHCTEF
jgi:2,4-dienoyl-CoA reductase-like NADH-dependent reductase (Old Yellow Enzyme family)